MRFKETLLALVAVLILVGGIPAAAEAPQEKKCSPSFVEVSHGAPIRTEAGSWSILFRVALIGCAEDLETLDKESLDTLREEFSDPSEWSSLLLVNEKTTQELRKEAVHRILEILGRPVVTDILFHDVTILDHNAQ